MDFRACVRTGFQNPVPQVRLKTNSGCSHGILVHSPGSSNPGVALGNFQSSLSGPRTSVLGLEFLHFGRAWTSQIWGNTRIFRAPPRWCFVSGHDFSRAAQAQQKIWALAPALFSWLGK